MLAYREKSLFKIVSSLTLFIPRNVESPTWARYLYLGTLGLKCQESQSKQTRALLAHIPEKSREYGFQSWLAPQGSKVIPIPFLSVCVSASLLGWLSLQQNFLFSVQSGLRGATLPPPLPLDFQHQCCYISLVLIGHMAFLEPMTVTPGRWCLIVQVWISGSCSLLELMVDVTHRDQLWSGWLSKRYRVLLSNEQTGQTKVAWSQVYFDQEALVSCKTEIQTSIFNFL